MFVLSMKTTRPRMLAACGIVTLLAVTVIALACGQKTVATAAVAPDEGGRIAYLNGLGYEVASGTGEVREVLIPVEFDDAFAAYNQLQQTAGMDLSPYRGKRVKCWTYTVTNVPDDGQILAHLYIYKDKVVGGDISSTAQNGFTQGLIANGKEEQHGTVG